MDPLYRPEAPNSRERGDELVLESLVQAVNDHDTYTGGHSYRTADYAAAIAEDLGYASMAVTLVRRAALVHDIGKIGIPDRILRKARDLSQDEVNLLRLHPVLGANILARMTGTERLIPIVLHHHERWDGTGYPSGLRGIEIPVESRIILVADAIDAMTTERPYGRILSTEEALDEIRHHAGKQFDPLIVDGAQGAFEAGKLVSDGQRTISLVDPEMNRI
jgi:putative nucleotidyltransferase with HDIG domain